MKIDQLSKIVERARCKITGWEEAENDGHRLTLGVLIQTFDNTESALLCEPSLARKTNRPPDIVLIDPEIGVHVFEIKAMDLDRIEAIEAGGQLRIRYASGVKTRSSIAQVRNATLGRLLQPHAGTAPGEKDQYRLSPADGKPCAEGDGRGLLVQLADVSPVAG
jgi:hypothetical protein